MGGPGDRASKGSLGVPTLCSAAEGQGEDPTRVDVDHSHSPESWSSARAQLPTERKPRDLGEASPSVVDGRQAWEGEKPQATLRSPEESDVGMVPEKLAKTWVTPVESVEGRLTAKGKPAARNAPPAQDGSSALTALQRVGKRAKQKRGEKFTNLLSHIKVPLLEEAYMRLNKVAATGVDAVTWDEYGERLDERLLDLQDRIHRGSYHPQPVRRVVIPKGDGRFRPLGVPALEDKIVQQAVRMVLEPIYEAMFVGFSYGFRPGRSPHDALDALAVAVDKKVSWVLDADIQSFFDTIDHGWMQQFIEHRIGDKRMVRLLMKWMRAGVMEDGELRAVKEGTPQGGIISPLLANIYLHYVLDLWVCHWRKMHAHGEVYIVRYADDFVMGFQQEFDVLTMRTALAERLGQFGLKLHPDKTRVLQFGRMARQRRARQRLGKPETFEFLGFVHITGVTRKDGRFQLRRHTSRKKRQAKLARLKEELKRRRHDPVAAQHEWLCAVLRGHYQYYAVPTNSSALGQFRWNVSSLWFQSLQRRSQRGRWTRVQREAFKKRFPLPTPRILHPWPSERLVFR